MHVQQDNAPAHVAADDEFVAEQSKSNGCDIILQQQPPNSPDFNVLDLGFFRSLQSATKGHEMNIIDNGVQFVTTEF